MKEKDGLGFLTTAAGWSLDRDMKNAGHYLLPTLPTCGAIGELAHQVHNAHTDILS